MKVDVMRTFKVDKGLWDAFLRACEVNDTTASREIREHIRKYVRQDNQGKLKL